MSIVDVEIPKGIREYRKTHFKISVVSGRCGLETMEFEEFYLPLSYITRQTSRIAQFDHGSTVILGFTP